MANSDVLSMFDPLLMQTGTALSKDIRASGHDDLGQKMDTLLSMMTEMLKMMKEQKEKSFGARMDRFFEKVSTKLQSAGTALSTTATRIKGHLRTFAKAVEDTAKDIWNKFEKSEFGQKVIAGARATKEQMVKFGQSVKGALEKLGTAMKKFFDVTLKPWFEEKGRAVKKAFDDAWEKAQPVLERGREQVVIGLEKAGRAVGKGTDFALLGVSGAAIAAGKVLQKAGMSGVDRVERNHTARQKAKDQGRTRL